jgi:hypothetical protein
VVVRHFESEAGEGALEHITAAGTTNFRTAHLVEAAKEAREELEVAFAGHVLTPLRGEKDERRAANAVPLQARIDQAISAQTIQVAPDCVVAERQRIGELSHRRLTVGADQPQDLFASGFHAPIVATPSPDCQQLSTLNAILRKKS